MYTQGKSEQMVGKFIADKKLRDRVVLATKFTFNAEPGNPNAGGERTKKYLSSARCVVAQAAGGLH